LIAGKAWKVTVFESLTSAQGAAVLVVRVSITDPAVFSAALEYKQNRPAACTTRPYGTPVAPLKLNPLHHHSGYVGALRLIRTGIHNR
jgi:hypothetical protein